MDKDTLILVSRRNFALYGVVFLIGAIFAARLFYLQILKHDFYSQAALSEQQAKFVVPAHRGQIYALDGDVRTPLVLNEVLPTVYVDPGGIDDEDNEQLAKDLSKILEVDQAFISERLENNENRYAVIKRRTPRSQIEALKKAELRGVGISDESYRVYPQKELSSQTLGFVNGDGEGQYGIEQHLDESLRGTDGRLNAVTDVYGIPLSTSDDGVKEAAINGQDVTLTIDVNIQEYVEEALERGVKAAKSESGSAIVVDPYTGAIKAMANYPSYDPTDLTEIEDFSVFSNDVVSAAYETGSGVKVFTMAAGLNEGAVTPDYSYYDAGYVQVDDRRIENAGTSGGVNRSMKEVIQNSVNTGVVHVLQQLGGGEINAQARDTLHEYFTTKFGFGSATGVEVANEASGIIFTPDSVEGNNVRYANMTFGQGMTVTMLQMVSGVSSLVNGGDYYQPHLIASTVDQNGVVVERDPTLLRKGVVSKQVSDDIILMMESVVDRGGGYSARHDGYLIGGKTGTSQVLDEITGEYSDTREIGSFIGFGGSHRPEYVIMTRVDEPQIPGYAGSVAAAPIFADISNWLIDYYQLPPSADR